MINAKTFALPILGFFLGVYGYSQEAEATPVTCISASGMPCIANAGDILADGVVVDGSGQDYEATVEAAIESATGGEVDITLYGKSDSNPGLFSFSGFNSGSTLTDSKSGSWSLLGQGIVMFITIKANGSFALYQILPGAISGTYSTLGILNHGGQQPNVSHISFWTTQNQGTEVPEPASMTLLLAGLAGAAGKRFRNKSKQA